MPKLKTKSAVKKRFKLTATGKLMARPAGSNHFKRRRSKSKLREIRKVLAVSSGDAKNVVKYFLPYGAN
jgi:large subunit ribosomal protein L35